MLEVDPGSPLALAASLLVIQSQGSTLSLELGELLPEVIVNHLSRRSTFPIAGSHHFGGPVSGARLVGCVSFADLELPK